MSTVEKMGPHRTDEILGETATPFDGLQVTAHDQMKFQFSVCTLVNSTQDYSRMRDSFERGGFDALNTEFLYIDNTDKNKHDAYSGINALINQSSGEYIIICHQDVTTIKDGAVELTDRLAELTRIAPDWGLVGNAGGTGPKSHAIRITDPHGADQHLGTLPARAEALDENFLVIRREANLAPSRDLTGFHLYGTDLAIQARMQGRSVWVIDFHLHHHSPGKMGEAYYDCLEALERKYANAAERALIHNTCMPVMVGRSWTWGWPTKIKRARKRWRQRQKDRRAR